MKIQINSHKRLLWPDVLKALAVFLVILGHVSSVYDSRGYSSPIALWIYSFHMPLFMMLSGMFFRFTLMKDFKIMLIDKSRQLILPLLSWGLVNFLIETLLFLDFNDWVGQIVAYIQSGGPLRGYWYLKCLFLYLVVNYMLVKMTNRLTLAALLSIILFLILPNINFSGKMIIFFWMGVYYEKLMKLINQKIALLFFGFASIGYYLFGDIKATYLTSSCSLIQYIQFVFTGAFSSLFWMSLFELWLPSKTSLRTVEVLQKIGTLSLGIYCIHEFFYFDKLYRPIFEKLNADSAVIQIMYSVVVLILSFAVINLISRSKYLALIFLGRKISSYQESYNNKSDY